MGHNIIMHLNQHIFRYLILCASFRMTGNSAECRPFPVIVKRAHDINHCSKFHLLDRSLSAYCYRWKVNFWYWLWCFVEGSQNKIVLPIFISLQIQLAFQKQSLKEEKCNFKQFLYIFRKLHTKWAFSQRTWLNSYSVWLTYLNRPHNSNNSSNHN